MSVEIEKEKEVYYKLNGSGLKKNAIGAAFDFFLTT